MSVMYRPSIAWLALSAARCSARSTCFTACVRRKDSPASSSTICVQSSFNGTCSSRGYRFRNRPSSVASAGAHKITATFGSIERRASASFPSFNGPITIRSGETPSPFLHRSLVTTERPGSWRSTCQQADSNRANSASSVRINTLVFRKSVPLPDCVSCLPLLRSRELQFLGFVECRKQALRADSQVHRRFRVLGLFGHFHAFLKARNLHARDGQHAVQPRRVSRFLGLL